MRGRTGVVLQLLTAAQKLGEPPVGRLALVKWVFLTELLRPTYELWQRAFDFVRYDYGPYSDDVLRRTEFLVIHGYANCNEFTYAKSGIRATYSAAPRGVELTIRLNKSHPEAALLANLSRDLIWTLQSLGIRTTEDICRIVYSEPAFADILTAEAQTTKPSGTPTALPAATHPDHPSFRVLSVLSALGADRFRQTVRPRDLIFQYLHYLAVMAIRSNSDSGDKA